MLAVIAIFCIFAAMNKIQAMEIEDHEVSQHVFIRFVAAMFSVSHVQKVSQIQKEVTFIQRKKTKLQ